LIRRPWRGRKFAVLVVGLVGVALMLNGCANGLFYYPDSRVYSTPAGAGQPFQDVWFTSRDGTKLHGWFIPATSQGPALGTVVHFHGNAQNMTAHYAFVSWLPAEGFNVFVFDYRGYAVVSYRHGEILLKKARQPKQLLTMPGAGHTAAAGSADMRRQIVAFMRQALQSASP
jgi:fermentation-respiration switch protein FrsA (DUF1100 family)